MVKYKTAFYSFYLPVALGEFCWAAWACHRNGLPNTIAPALCAGMIVGGVTRKDLFDQARDILMIMGEYFQIQDDYLDCYGTPEIIGKIGTDIQDNKCGWLVVQALQRATPAQRQVLEVTMNHFVRCSGKRMIG